VKRVRLYRIPDEIMLELITGQAKAVLPVGAKLERTFRDEYFGTTVFEVSHPSFRPVLQGQAIEGAELIVLRWSAYPG
jgi:hypothetical protein